MTGNKDSPEVVKFMLLFQRLKDWSDDDPDALPELASTDESIKDLCLKLLKAAGSIQRNERGDRERFAGPVDLKFVSAWRELEERYADVLWIVVAAMRPSAVAELPNTVGIRIRRNFRPKSRQTREND